MTLSESIINIHSLAARTVGELEADELVTSLLVLTLNNLKRTGELKPENLEEAFKEKFSFVEKAQQSGLEIDEAITQRPKLYLVSND